MKNLLLSMFVLMQALAFSQNSAMPIFSITSNGITSNSQFIIHNESSIANLAYTTTTSLPISINNTVIDVKMGRFNGWQNEPGNFDVIRFDKNNIPLLTFRYDEGIVRLNNNANLYAYRFNGYSNNGYFIEEALSPTEKAVIFLGQHYGTDVAELIIFIVTPDEVKLVFCKKMAITAIVRNPNTFSLALQSNIIGEGQGTPITHTIWKQDGVLWFKNN